MEVILREDVEKIGARGAVVKVADGYARNYLLPKRLAVAATESNKKIVEQEREAHLRREAKLQIGSRRTWPTSLERGLDLQAPRGRERSTLWFGHGQRYRRCARGSEVSRRASSCSAGRTHPYV